jgi:ribonuclease T2
MSAFFPRRCAVSVYRFLFLLALSAFVRAESPAVPAFDYYTLAVSLTPGFCDQNPKWRDSRQCRDRFALTVHGLWPERVQGRAPEFCAGGELTLTAVQERSLRDIMPDAGLRGHEWKKHGRCSGLDGESYFARTERFFRAVKWPDTLRPVGRDNLLERDALLRDIQRLNPAIPAKGLVLRCEKKGRPPLLTEIRLCLSPQGRPVECASNFKPNCPVAIKVRAR